MLLAFIWLRTLPSHSLLSWLKCSLHCVGLCGPLLAMQKSTSKQSLLFGLAKLGAYAAADTTTLSMQDVMREADFLLHLLHVQNELGLAGDSPLQAGTLAAAALEQAEDDSPDAVLKAVWVLSASPCEVRHEHR